MRTPMRLLALGTLLVASSLTACAGIGPSPRETFCEGVSSEMGGCDPARRHRFTATTCGDIAREWATFFDAEVVRVLDGPATVGDSARSAFLARVLAVTMVDATRQLQALSLQARCDVPEFMAAAEPLFSDRVRADAGKALYDGDPVATYDEWLADVRTRVGIIDEGE
jgi:hypothetical protein